jgi:hypothetical protein
MTGIIEELHLGANILLAYFHYCCKGFQPFDLDWDASETTSMAELDAEQVKFVRKTADFVSLQSMFFFILPFVSDQSQGAHFHDIKEKLLYEDEHYYVAQLFETDWTPSSIKM